MQMENKSFGGKTTEVKQIDRNGIPVGIISGYIATWDIDRGFRPDKFMPGAFAESLEEHRQRNRQIRFKDNHYRVMGGFPIETAKEDEKGLFAIGEVNLETQIGREAFSLAKQGVLVDFSIGFSATEWEIKDDLRIIPKAVVWEGSLIDEPMNPKAIVTEIKAAIEQAETIRELEYALRDAGHLSKSAAQYLCSLIHKKGLRDLSHEEIKSFTQSVDEWAEVKQALDKINKKLLEG